MHPKIKKNFDDYKYDTAYVECPKFPKLLHKPSWELTKEEFEIIPALKREYDEQYKAYEKLLTDLDTKQKSLTGTFYKDLCEYLELDNKNEFCEAMFACALKNNGELDLLEILDSMENMKPLYELYNRS